METPLFTALMEFKRRDTISFHVPGHKNGTVLSEVAIPLYKEMLSVDVTELTGLDDLHDPSGVIEQAQQLTAELYGVRSSYFLVNGSTVGNLAMVLACCGNDDVVLVQRNSHKSIMHALQLAGAHPVFLHPKIDQELMVPSYVEFETIKQAIEDYPNAKALIITNPNYYGLSVDLSTVIEQAHQARIPVLIDEAHGAHFIAGEQFPVSAVHIGADIIVHSAHKTLPAMTMGSFLHFNSEIIDQSKVEYYLSILQSSSPSYPIMASLDLARGYLEEIVVHNSSGQILEAVEATIKEIEEIEGIELIYSNDEFVRRDPLKLTLRATDGRSGYELQSWLEERNVFVELADPINVLLVLPLHKENEGLAHLKTGAHQNANKFIQKLHYVKSEDEKKIHQLEHAYTFFQTCKKRVVPLDEAIGAFSYDFIVPYPPGIPFLVKGEKITGEAIEQLKDMIRLGVNIQGDNQLKKGKITILEK
ncbi:aminotransferase class I/II-fold pyridoxal phosphate-dependent enzyme [Bacillus weihaiensis]|uniref:Arginine decarboxylase n=1 Tax=Bacillus weihaiensis TaxID=1547283 RepID=A0A1L3MWN0_9BACI|nr:aminotransferase class V-fold PLP-dependent enzyme [Bacillus weihaiensis]APH06749.1 hypothetical protein A9C19_19775 [Bacillus weihaiensis]